MTRENTRVVELLLFLIAWLGHACFVMAILNILYAQPIHRDLLKRMRIFLGVVIFFTPPILKSTLLINYSQVLDQALSENRWGIGAIYISTCLIISGVILPAITIQRLLRKQPKKLLLETTTTYDLEKELGYRPIGDGKYSRLAKYRWNQLFKVDFTELTLCFPNLPKALDSLTILHISDLHWIGTPGKIYYEWIFTKAISSFGEPDLVVITGDLIDTDDHIAWLASLRPLLSWKSAGLAILGNHDYWCDHEKLRKELVSQGFINLGNSYQLLQIRGETVALIGQECPWFTPSADVSTIPDGVFRICLSHTPDNISFARKAKVDLMLSGHNHGGQIRLPLFGSIFVPSFYGRRFDMGTFQIGDMVLHVSRGLGEKEPLRFHCNPQITRICLKRAASSDEK